MNENQATGPAAVLQATVTVTRKATGKVEEYQLTGYLSKEQAEAMQNEATTPQEIDQ